MSQRKKDPELARTRAVGARTVVMDRPPEMTMVPGPASQRVPPAPPPARRTTSATPSMMLTTVRPAQRPPPPPTVVLTRPVLPPPLPLATARPQPAPPSKPMPARTRMVDLRDALAANQRLPPLQVSLSHPPLSHPQRPHAPPGPSAPALMSMPRSAIRWKRVLQERRSLLAVAAGALVLLLLVPQLMSEGEAEAREQGASASARQAATLSAAATPELAPAAPGLAVSVSMEPIASAPEPTTITTPDSQPSGPLSEAHAGALLLSGDRAQALASYRELAQRPGAHPGIEAMVIVLEQKVNPR